MKTTDLFKTSSKKLNEGIEKIFGKKLNLESFDLPKLEDARNKLRTQVYQVRSQSGFNENLDNEALTQAQWMLDTINAEIAERQELIADAHAAEIEYEDDMEEGFDPKEWEGETYTVFVGDDGEEVDGVLYYKAKANPETGRVSVKLIGGDVTGDNSNAKVDDEMIKFLLRDPDYNREAMADAQDAAQAEWDARDADIPQEGAEVEEVFSDDEAQAQRDATKDRAWDAKGQANTKRFEKNQAAAKRRAQQRAANKAVGEGAEFGAYDYEQLAQQVFDKNPELSTDGSADELMSIGYALAKQEYGDSRARYMFRSEDFPGDFVSAYGYLQDGGDDKEPEPDFDQEYNDESIGSDHVNRDEKLKRMGAKPLSTLDKLKIMPHQAKAMTQGDSEDDLVNYNKMKARAQETINYDAISKLSDKELDDRHAFSNIRVHKGSPEHTAVRKALEKEKQNRSQKTNEVAPPGDKYERIVKHIKKGYAKDGGLSDKEKSIAYATAWKAKNKNESIEGDNMSTLREGEIQQASAIVSAKTMVDRVGRWIEELSGMENDTLLQLGDQIRDEMGAEQAKTFISSVAPAIQSALENLKSTREALATGVRTLTGEEQAAGMLGAEPGAEAGADEFGAEPAETDAMNTEPAGDEFAAGSEDEFAAAEPAAGGLGDAGRAKRESIDFGNSLLKVLAG